MNYSSFLTYHLVCYKNNTTNTTGGAGTAYLSGTPKLHPRFLVGFVLLNHQFSVWCFSFVIILSVARFPDSDCPSGVFKLYLWNLTFKRLVLERLRPKRKHFYRERNVISVNISACVIFILTSGNIQILCRHQYYSPIDVDKDIK